MPDQNEQELKDKLTEIQDKAQEIFNDKIVAFIVRNPTLAKILGFALPIIGGALTYFFGS